MNDWNNKSDKRAATVKVLQHIIKNYAAGQACLGNDAAAKQLFEDPAIGNMKVPDGQRVAIFPNDEDNNPGGSLILRLPPQNQPLDSTDDQLIAYQMGNYPLWGG